MNNTWLYVQAKLGETMDRDQRTATLKGKCYGHLTEGQGQREYS